MKNSEFSAYVFIQNTLKELGWNVKNPLSNGGGQVYTQHEALKDTFFKNVYKERCLKM